MGVFVTDLSVGSQNRRQLLYLTDNIAVAVEYLTAFEDIIRLNKWLRMTLFCVLFVIAIAGIESADLHQFRKYH
jgi:hypothetical protein